MMRVQIASIVAAVLLTACETPPTARTTAPRELGSATNTTVVANAGTNNTQGIGGAMPAFYDAKLFTINFSELPSGGESAKPHP
jgi:hypothetical protein